MKMQRDSRSEWPDDNPIGSFDVELGAPEGYAATAHILFVCPNGHRCSVLLGPTFVGRSTSERLNVWQLDGNMDKLTIGKPTGGCGWHGFITSGEMN